MHILVTQVPLIDGSSYHFKQTNYVGLLPINLRESVIIQCSFISVYRKQAADPRVT